MLHLRSTQINHNKLTQEHIIHGYDFCKVNDAMEFRPMSD